MANRHPAAARVGRRTPAAVKYLEIPKTGLRSGDALHLAVAVNHGARRILTLDRGFLAAGKLLRLPVSRGIKA